MGGVWLECRWNETMLPQVREGIANGLYRVISPSLVLEPNGLYSKIVAVFPNVGGLVRESKFSNQISLQGSAQKITTTEIEFSDVSNRPDDTKDYFFLRVGNVWAKFNRKNKI